MASHITSTARTSSTRIQMSQSISAPTTPQTPSSNTSKESKQFLETVSSNGESANRLVQESPKIRRTLDEIEKEPYPEARIWNIKASELEQWRQVLSIQKNSLILNIRPTNRK